MTDTASTSSEAGGFSRRRLLGSAAAAGALGAAAVALPPNVQKALAAPRPAGGRRKDIKHVVLLMQENRSFDHYYGTLRGVRGFSDPKPARLPGGRTVFFQPDPSNPDGYLLPYRLNTQVSAAQAIPSLSHDWGPQHSALDAGKMDNWVPAHVAADGAANGPYTMGYYTRQDIPFQYALADAFTIFDNYFTRRTARPGCRRSPTSASTSTRSPAIRCLTRRWPTHRSAASSTTWLMTGCLP